jgi:hypothetical protein
MSQPKVTEYIDKKRMRKSSSDPETEGSIKNLSKKKPPRIDETSDNTASSDSSDYEKPRMRVENKKSVNRESNETDQYSASDVMEMLKEIKVNQDDLRKSVDQRITNFERNMEGWMKEEVENIKTNFSPDIEILNK